MIEIHRSALEEVIVPYSEFLRAQLNTKKRLFGFIEGKDDYAYYNHHILHTINNDDWELILIESGFPNGNKDRVLRLLKLIDWNNYSCKQTAFFIDKDLNDFCGTCIDDDYINLYITDNYSIENDIVTIHTLKRALLELFGLSFTDDEFDVISNLFSKGLKDLSLLINIISSFYIYFKKNKKDVIFDKINLKDLVNINKCEVKTASRKIIVNYVKEKWPYDYDELNFKKIYKDFSKKNTTYKHTRGKFIMWYFINFIKSLCDNYNNIIPRTQKKLTRGRDLCPKNAIIDLAPRSRTPQSLNSFVNATYLSYIQEKST